MFPEFPDDAVYVSMTDALDPLAPFSKHAFHLDDFDWPENIRMAHCEAGPEARYECLTNIIAELTAQ